jgi:hypothetical protein
MAFFEAGKTYTEKDPYLAPEVRQIFQCVAVAEMPRDGQLRAFGFGNSALRRQEGWYSTGLTPGDWGRGWIETTTEE